jgi:hypothetical protein
MLGGNEFSYGLEKDMDEMGSSKEGSSLIEQCYLPPEPRF